MKSNRKQEERETRDNVVKRSYRLHGNDCQNEHWEEWKTELSGERFHGAVNRCVEDD